MPSRFDVDQARELVDELLAVMPPPADDAWIVTHVTEYHWGWAFSWLNGRAAAGSTSSDDTYVGGGPFLVDRQTGRVAMCGSAYPVEHYIEAWRNGDLPDIPRP